MMRVRDHGNTRKRIENYSYFTTDRIGRGYSSQVYKGKNEITNEYVAIKVIDMKLIKGQTHRNLLQEETEVLKVFKYPENVIEVYDIFKTRDYTYIITEYCEGGDLSKIIKQGVSQSEAIGYLKQIVNGYLEIFRRRIVHRDLKPANILLKNSEIKIADFGFASRQHEYEKKCSYNVGSPIYMPPQALNENIYSCKSDIWAIGVIFYEMLTGKTPWRAKTEKDLGKSLKNIPIQKLIPKNISQESINFLLKTLNIAQSERVDPYQLQEQLKYFSNNQLRKAKSSSILRYLPQKKNDSHLEKTQSSSKYSHKKLAKMHLAYPSIATPASTKEEKKHLSLPKTAASIIINKTDNQILLPSQVKQISKQYLSQIHFMRFTYKLAQRIQKTYENCDFGVKEALYSLIAFKLEEIKDLILLCSTKRRSYMATEQYSKVKRVVDQYEFKYQKQVSLKDKILNWSSYADVKKQIKLFISSEVEKLRGNLETEEMLDNEEKNSQRIIILDYLITLKQLIDLQEKKNSLAFFHSSSQIQKIVEGNPVKQIKKDHINAILSKVFKINILE